MATSAKKMPTLFNLVKRSLNINKPTIIAKVMMPTLSEENAALGCVAIAWCICKLKVMYPKNAKPIIQPIIIWGHEKRVFLRAICIPKNISDTINAITNTINKEVAFGMAFFAMCLNKVRTIPIIIKIATRYIHPPDDLLAVRFQEIKKNIEAIHNAIPVNSRLFNDLLNKK